MLLASSTEGIKAGVQPFLNVGCCGNEIRRGKKEEEEEDR